MKKTIKIIGIIALFALIGLPFVSCNHDPGADSFGTALVNADPVNVGGKTVGLLLEFSTDIPMTKNSDTLIVKVDGTPATGLYPTGKLGQYTLPITVGHGKEKVTVEIDKQTIRIDKTVAADKVEMFVVLAAEKDVDVIKTTAPGAKPEVDVETVTITAATATTLTAVGATVQINATVKPDNATNKAVTWTSSDTDVATVSATGLVTAKANGTTYITATAGGVTSAAVEVTVSIVVVPPDTDTTAPELSGLTATRDSETEATIAFSSDEDGYAYYLVMASGAAEPTKEAVYDDGDGDFAGLVEKGTNTLSIDVTAAAADIYVVVIDEAGNLSIVYSSGISVYTPGGPTAVTVAITAVVSASNDLLTITITDPTAGISGLVAGDFEITPNATGLTAGTFTEVSATSYTFVLIGTATSGTIKVDFKGKLIGTNDYQAATANATVTE